MAEFTWSSLHSKDQILEQLKVRQLWGAGMALFV